MNKFLFFIISLLFLFPQKKENSLLFENYISKYYFKNKANPLLKWQANKKKDKIIYSLNLLYTKKNIFNFFITVINKTNQAKRVSSVAMTFENNISVKKGIFVSFGKKIKKKIKFSNTQYKLFLRNNENDVVFFSFKGYTDTLVYKKGKRKDGDVIKLNLFKKINDNNVMVINFYLNSIKNFKSLIVFLDNFNLQYKKLK